MVYRQEVLWDVFEVDGATLANGSFESPTSGWQSAGGSIVGQTSDALAVAGTNYARTWHNQTLFTTLEVSARKPVTIRVHARAVRPEGFREMKRITCHDTPAHQAARRFLRGANLGNGLEVPPGQNWGLTYTAQDIHHIRAQGFDHVRIPIGWHHCAGPGPEFLLKPEIFRKVDALVTPALKEELNVLINIHHFDEFSSNPTGASPEFNVRPTRRDASVQLNYERLPFTELGLPGQRDDHALALLDMCGLGGFSGGGDTDLVDTLSSWHLERQRPEAQLAPFDFDRLMLTSPFSLL